jgi:hypothetical protein
MREDRHGCRRVSRLLAASGHLARNLRPVTESFPLTAPRSRTGLAAPNSLGVPAARGYSYLALLQYARPLGSRLRFPKPPKLRLGLNESSDQSEYLFHARFLERVRQELSECLGHFAPKSYCNRDLPS